MPDSKNVRPEHTLSVTDAVAVTVGVVIGAGIFKTPSIVAAQAGNEWAVLSLWLVGGVVSLAGALCYAELSSAWPHAGGDYVYLVRAYGGSAGFLFVWARMTVIQTGSIAMWAFLIGDYATQVADLGTYSTSLYAASSIILLTLLNAAGIRPGVGVQKLLITGIVLGLIATAAVGIIMVRPSFPARPPSMPPVSGMGSAMIFVLLTFGGWNEAVYLSGELRDPRRNMVKVLLASIAVITIVYLVINAVFIASLGIDAVAASEAVAADLMRLAAGEWGARFISLLICVAALSSMNGVMITSARTNYALGRDYPLFSFLGTWEGRRGTPVNALAFLGAVSLSLVLFGTASRSGFVTMVDYTAPVFWFFFLLVGLSLFVLRRREPGTRRPFSVPLFPLTPIVFCAACAWMLYSSISYTGKGSLLGVAVLVAGIPLLLFGRGRPRPS